MLVSVDVDTDLLHSVMKATGLTSEREVVETALRALIEEHRRRQREAIETLRTLGPWEGDLDAMRRDTLLRHDR